MRLFGLLKPVENRSTFRLERGEHAIIPLFISFLPQLYLPHKGRLTLFYSCIAGRISGVLTVSSLFKFWIATHELIPTSSRIRSRPFPR